MSTRIGNELKGPLNEKVQVVIVGSGAGGANAALRLVELGVDVLLLEYGGHKQPQDFSHEDGVALPMLFHESGMRLVSGDSNFPLLAARTLGGSTVVNSGICLKTPKKILDGFVNEQGIDWAAKDTIEPLYDWVYDYMRIAPHSDAILGPHNLTTRSAFQKMGWHVDPIPRNAPTCVGCGLCQFGCPSGGKFSVDKAQIRDGLAKGLKVVTRARVDKVLKGKNGNVTGVEGVFVKEDGHTPTGNGFTIEADAVVVAAGAIDSPLLLQRSGFGGPSEGIGSGLHIHPPVGVFGYFPDRRLEMWRGVTQGIYSHEFLEEGMLLESAASMTPPVFYSMGSGSPMDPFEWMRMLPHLALSGLMIHDEGEGTVKKGLFGKAGVSYHFTDYDIERLKRGMVYVAEAYFKEGAQGVIPGIKHAPMAKNMTELKGMVAKVNHAAQLHLYASHPQSTIRIHADKTQGPLSPKMNLHGWKNLFVVDASVFPDCLGVNPQVTIMAAARHASQYVADVVG